MAVVSDQLDDLLLGNDDPFAEAHASGGDLNAMATTAATAGAKTTGESDEFNTKMPATDAAAGTEQQQKDAAPFDDFFAEQKMPATAAAATEQEKKDEAEVDPFDDFFAERSSGK